MTFFQFVAEQCSEPFKILMTILDEKIPTGYFNNWLIAGQNPQEKEAAIKACYVVGIVPSHQDFINGQFITASVDKQNAWAVCLKQGATTLSRAKEFESLSLKLIRLILGTKIDITSPQVVGLLSVHTVLETEEQFTLMHGHPNLPKMAVEHIIKCTRSDNK